MITNLRLANFKAFIDLDVTLRPITVLLGPNNSGKSSLLAAIRLLSQTLQSHDPAPPLLLSGAFGDFGTYRDIVFLNHRGRPMKLGISVLRTPGPDQPQDSPASSTPVSLDLEFKYRAVRREIVLISSSLRQGSRPLLETKFSKDSERQTLTKLGNRAVPPELRASLSSSLRMQNFLPRARPYGPGFTSRDSAITTWFGKANIESVFEAARRAAFTLETQLSLVEYLGPFRAPPERTYSFSGERRTRVGPSGQFASDIFMTDSARPKTRSTIAESINTWFKAAQVARKIEVVPISDRHYEIRITHFVSNERQNIADVGYGNSQILPVLVAGYNCRPGSCLIVEQPELHLHPRAQTHLATFVAQLHDNRVQSIIETHSEYVVIGLQELVAQRRIAPKDVALYYVHPLGETKTADLIELDESARFMSEWPEGFFPERLDLAKRLSIARASDP